jgi:hypothetical protein
VTGSGPSSRKSGGAARKTNADGTDAKRVRADTTANNPGELGQLLKDDLSRAWYNGAQATSAGKGKRAPPGATAACDANDNDHHHRHGSSNDQFSGSNRRVRDHRGRVMSAAKAAKWAKRDEIRKSTEDPRARVVDALQGSCEPAMAGRGGNGGWMVDRTDADAWWTCRECAGSNRMHRATCYRCGTKADDSPASASTASASKDQRSMEHKGSGGDRTPMKRSKRKRQRSGSCESDTSNTRHHGRGRTKEKSRKCKDHKKSNKKSNKSRHRDRDRDREEEEDYPRPSRRGKRKRNDADRSSSSPSPPPRQENERRAAQRAERLRREQRERERTRAMLFGHTASGAAHGTVQEDDGTSAFDRKRTRQQRNARSKTRLS